MSYPQLNYPSDLQLEYFLITPQKLISIFEPLSKPLITLCFQIASIKKYATIGDF